MTTNLYVPTEWCTPPTAPRPRTGIMARDSFGNWRRFLDWDQWRFCIQHRIWQHSHLVTATATHRLI